MVEVVATSAPPDSCSLVFAVSATLTPCSWPGKFDASAQGARPGALRALETALDSADWAVEQRTAMASCAMPVAGVS